MEEFNPYAAPQAPLLEESEASERVLADRRTGFVAQPVDGLVILIPAVVVMLVAFLGIPALLGSRPGLGWPFQMGIGVLQFALIMGIYLAINGRLLATRGQTVGKKACGIKPAGSSLRDQACGTKPVGPSLRDQDCSARWQPSDPR